MAAFGDTLEPCLVLLVASRGERVELLVGVGAAQGDDGTDSLDVPAPARSLDAVGDEMLASASDHGRRGECQIFRVRT